jgi:hypothetical protein
MGALENELVDHAINAHRSTYQLSFNILGVRVNKMVCVKGRERLSPYAAGELYTSATHRNSSYVAKEHTVGTWLTYGSCTIVAIVCGTDRFSNSQYVCSSQIASRSNHGPFMRGFKNDKFRVCDTDSML